LVLISESQDQVSKQHLLLSKFGLQCGRQTPTTVLLYADICNHLTAVKITRTHARTHTHTHIMLQMTAGDYANSNIFITGDIQTTLKSGELLWH